MPPKNPPDNNADDTQGSKVSVVLSRALKITLEGVEHALQAGANRIDAVLADHWLVKAHTLNGENVADSAANAETEAQIADLTTRLAEANATIDAMQAAANAGSAQIADQQRQIAEMQGMLDAFKATAGGGK